MRIVELLEKSKALLEGHFILSSGLHSPNYLQCALMLQYPDMAEEAGKLLAKELKEFKADLVASPALGGIVIGQEVARALGVRAIFGERPEKEMVFRRGFEVKEGERVIVIEDVVTTGKSSKEIIELVRKAKGIPVAVGCLVFRGKENPFGLPLKYLWKVEFPVYDPKVCPQCKEESPAIKPGSRK
ncbi:MAG: orotate phosphoribosyltransferase [Thermoanaerobaculia bacterium]